MPDVPIPEGTVTVLFTDLVGSTELNQALGDTDARELGRRLDQLARDAVDANRGIPIKELGDGVMAAFTSARRAIACAREIQRGVAEHNRERAGPAVAMRIGLHTGEVIEEDGDLHGETVIVAKRIEATARPGTILASDTVHGVLGTARDELVDAGEHSLKGLAASRRLYEVPWDVDRADAPGRRTPYVGREEERARVRALLQRATEGHGALLVVSGDAGVGKSRLVAEALADAASAGAAVLTGQCIDMSSPPPFQPVVDQIDAAARALSPDRFREVLGDHAAEVATLVPALRQRYDDLPEPPPLPPDQERQYVLHGVAAFLARATEDRPLVLVFEDLHWADESTLVLLQALTPRLAALRLLVIVTHRPVATERTSPLASALPTLVRMEPVVELPLAPLAVGHVAALLERRAGQPAPPALVERVFAETDGNPYFVEELYRHLEATGKLFDAGGGWRPDLELGETEVPEGVQRLVGRRLDHLGPAPRRHLAVAAVIGRTFTFDVLEAVAASDEDELFDALEAAERLHVVEDATTGRTATYRFTHELVRQTLLGDLSVARRQRVHLRVARALVDRVERAPDAPGRTVEVSHHYELAGSAADDAEAAAAHLAAAHTALDAVAFEDALVHLDRAELRLTADPERRAEALGVRARCLQGLARVDDALAALRAGLDAVAADVDVGFDLRSQLVTLLLDLFRGEEAFAEVATLAGHPRTARRSDKLDVLLLTARAHYIRALDDREHAARARDCYRRAHELAVELGDDRRAIRALLATRWFTDYWADYRPTAVANVREAERLVAGIDDVDLALDVEIAAFQIGAHREHDVEARRLLDHLEARRDPLRLKEHCFLLMWYHFGRGQFADAVAMCDRGIELAEQLGVPPVMYGSLKALSLVEMGRYDEVESALDQEVTSEDHPFGRAMAVTARTYLLSRIEAWEAAIEQGVEAFRQLGALDRVHLQRFPRRDVMVAAARLGIADPLDGVDSDVGTARAARAVAAELALGRGDAADALAQATEQFERAAAAARGRDTVLAQLVRAEAAWRVEAEEAVDIATDGLALAEANGQGSVVWQLRAVLGQALRTARRPEADEVLDWARTEFEALAARIADPGLRAWFERQPRAALLD